MKTERRERIFISYRRDETAAEAEEVYRRLSRYYGSAEVFIDHAKIPAGVEFLPALKKVIQGCRVMVAIVGNSWVTAIGNDGKPKLENPQDWMRFEIETALSHGVPIITVLTGRAEVPKRSDLPDSIQRLVDFNAVPVRTGPDYSIHMERVIEAVKSYAGRWREKLASRLLICLSGLFAGIVLWQSGKLSERVVISPETASQQRPYINSLGMQFVPVPNTDVLFSKWETRVGDFEQFIADNPAEDTGNAARFLTINDWEVSSGVTWKAPGFPQNTNHPVVCVSRQNAKAFCDWLSRREGRTYRLPTDREWSMAINIGHMEVASADSKTKTKNLEGLYPWGEWANITRNDGNYAGQETESMPRPSHYRTINDELDGMIFNDGFPYTSPVGAFNPNVFGICDLSGNVWEMCMDLYNPDEVREGFEDVYIVRGGCWLYENDFKANLASAFRGSMVPSYRQTNLGFRCVMQLQ